jgi:hypothetical protein
MGKGAAANPTECTPRRAHRLHRRHRWARPPDAAIRPNHRAWALPIHELSCRGSAPACRLGGSAAHSAAAVGRDPAAEPPRPGAEGDPRHQRGVVSGAGGTLMLHTLGSSASQRAPRSPSFVYSEPRGRAAAGRGTRKAGASAPRSPSWSSGSPRAAHRHWRGQRWARPPDAATRPNRCARALPIYELSVKPFMVRQGSPRTA